MSKPIDVEKQMQPTKSQDKYPAKKGKKQADSKFMRRVQGKFLSSLNADLGNAIWGVNPPARRSKSLYQQMHIEAILAVYRGNGSVDVVTNDGVEHKQSGIANAYPMEDYKKCHAKIVTELSGITPADFEALLKPRI